MKLISSIKNPQELLQSALEKHPELAKRYSSSDKEGGIVMMGQCSVCNRSCVCHSSNKILE